MTNLVALLHLAVTAENLGGPGGVRAVIAENLLLRQQLTVLRRMVGLGVSHGAIDGPSLCRMFNDAIRGQRVPRQFSTDHDPRCDDHRRQAHLRVREIDEIKTVPPVPLSHPFVERLIGTTRRLE